VRLGVDTRSGGLVAVKLVQKIHLTKHRQILSERDAEVLELHESINNARREANIMKLLNFSGMPAVLSVYETPFVL
jgi:hypothetical protein